MKKNILFLLFVVLSFVACEEQFEPVDDNHLTTKRIYEDATFAEGVLMNAYTLHPYIYGFSYNDVATDDAVSNNKSNSYLQMATGQWTAQSNPVNKWDRCFEAVLYINKLLAEVEAINWAPLSGEKFDKMFEGRHKGEAYGLRALFYFYLLEAHAGYDDGGQLLGVPIITESPEDPAFDFKRPRSTFKECLDFIYKDLNEAEKCLPFDYVDITDASQMVDMYKSLGVTVDEYNRVFGEYYQLRLNARIVKGIRAKVALLAASPAYAQETWANAADYAADVLDLINGVSGLDPKGNLFYLKDNVDNLNTSEGIDQAEMLWRSNLGKSDGRERDNFPPTLYGSGRINPTQNLVDAFPMANGYPITDAGSGYDASNPYAGRDPRLSKYIVLNGSSMSSKTITTEIGQTNDGVDAISTSTRTGYYMRKLLREDVSLDPTLGTTQNHFNVFIRYTEIFLAYAEAANEAWGPDGRGANGFSAREVIAAIRNRAGIAQPDSYLASITTTEDMRTLIHNERRLELCFEGFRFWDLRRWKKPLNEVAKGVRIAGGNYTISNVEERIYKDYMIYCPIPYQETLKFNLIQNLGW